MDNFNVEDLSEKQWYKAICHDIGRVENSIVCLENKLNRIIEIMEIVYKDKLKAS